ncbi:MAG: hypothetical protein RLZZ501_2794 [Pseudomonadota bacterium]|jgi:hypothetical protein
MTETCQITITLSETTLATLREAGLDLLVCRAFASSAARAQPTVWRRITDLAERISITVGDGCEAYVSHDTTLTEGHPVTFATLYPVGRGQTLAVTAASGTGQVLSTGTPDMIEIFNKTSTRFSCGLATAGDTARHPLCALPLFGNSIALIRPLPRVLLTVTSRGLAEGSVIRRALAPSLLIDCTGAPDHCREVSYDLDRDWQANTEGWASRHPADADLAALLAQQSNAISANADAAPPAEAETP